jgi:SET domain-containing protein
MGFKFKIAVQDSIYEGKGLFALEFIPAGRVISTFFPEEDDVPVEGHSLEKITSYSKDDLAHL